MMRPVWTLTLGVVMGLVITGLVDASWYTGEQGGAGWLALAVIAALVGLLVAARRGDAELPRPGEFLAVALMGLVLTTLFWFRARAGLATGWLVGIELTMLALFAWAWPALIPVLLYRRAGEGWRPACRRRLLGLTGVALLAGAFGYALHFLVWQLYDGAGFRKQANHPLSLHRVIIRPTETPIAIAALGGSRNLSTRPLALVATHPADPERGPIEVAVKGRLLSLIERDLSWDVQGTRVESSDPRVVSVDRDESGRWQLHPGLPGPAIVTVRNRRAEAWIGVWVTNRSGSYAPFEVVTERFRIKPVSVPQREGEFLYRQTLRLYNRTDEPVLGPIYAVFHTGDSPRVAISSGRSTRRIEPAGKPYVQALTPGPGNRAPVIGPGEAVDFDVLAVPELTREWLHFHVDLLQAFDPP